MGTDLLCGGQLPASNCGVNLEDGFLPKQSSIKPITLYYLQHQGAMCCWRQDRTKVPAIVIAKGLRGCSLQGRERDAAWPNSRVCSFKDPHLSCIVLMCSITELPLLYPCLAELQELFSASQPETTSLMTFIVEWVRVSNQLGKSVSELNPKASSLLQKQLYSVTQRTLPSAAWGMICCPGKLVTA